MCSYFRAKFLTTINVNDGTKDKLQFYRNFTAILYPMENYDQNFNYRRSFSRLRLRNHTIEDRTWKICKRSQNSTERLCIFCNNSEIENESHMLLYCPLYSNVRDMCFNEIGEHKPHLRHLPEFAKLQIIMNPRKSIANVVAKFVHSCFNIRKRHAISII